MSSSEYSEEEELEKLRKKEFEKRRVALRHALRACGVDARILEWDPLSPEPFRYKNDEDPIVWIEIADGPVRWVDPFPSSEHRHWHFYVPDSRLGSYPELGYAEVYSEFRRRFPVFGRVESVRWLVGGPCELKPRDEHFYEHVVDILNQDTAVTEALMTASTDFLEVYVDHECRVICDKFEGTFTFNRTRWDCYQAIAKDLLAMPMPTDQ